MSDCEFPCDADASVVVAAVSVGTVSGASAG